MALIDRITKTIGGPVAASTPNPADQDSQQRRQEENQQRDNLPSYPHAEEPQETRAEHAVERTMGHEVRPASRIPSIVRAERPLPRSLRPGFPPQLTNAGAMFRRKLPSGLTHAPPTMKTGSMSFTVPAEKKTKQDPFRAFKSDSMFSIDVFARPKKRRNKGWF